VTVRRGLRLGLTLVLAILVVGCGRMEARPARNVLLDGQEWLLLLATADGMRGATSFDGADGMLFDRGDEVDPDSVFFVMDGVAMPLDIAWFDANGRFVGMAAMPTCGDPVCPRFAAPGPFRWAIEAPPGAFDGFDAETRLEVGDS
jgi:uncharacterized membrane protein (UPF0127 family)